MDELKNKISSIHTMEFYSVLRMIGIRTCVMTWMNLEDIMLSEVSQSQKDKHCTIPLI